MNGHESTNPAWKEDHSPMMRELYWQRRCELAEELLKHTLTNKEIGRACHIHDLEEKNNRLKAEITHQREAAEYRNRQLIASNLIVSCSGGCETGIMGCKDKINEEVVAEVERTAKRLRSWWTNYQFKQARKRNS